MLNQSNILFRYAIKTNLRCISLVKKSKTRIQTQDERLFPNYEEYSEPKYKPIRNIISARKVISFYDKYFDKSIEGIHVDDERLGLFLNARSLNDNNDLLVIEGINMIRDCINLNGQMTHIYFTKRDILKEIPFANTCNETKIYYITYKDMKKISNLATPPGIIAIFKRPDPTTFLVDPVINKKLPVTLIMDQIRDPGNVGSIIRTAAGFNIHKIILANGCVDLYNEKVLRGSMSSIFCTPVFHKLSWNEIRNSLHPDTMVYYADVFRNKDDVVSFPYYDRNIGEFKSHHHYALVIGGEINGVSNEAKNLSNDTHGCKLHIPIVNSVNSLNSSVSAAIILSDFQRKFLLSE